MTRRIAFVAMMSLLAACGDDDGTPVVDSPPNIDARLPDASVDAAMLPTMPAVGGTQIDRMGRAAINTALNSPFQPDMTMKTAAKDAYNQLGDQTMWLAMFGTEVARNAAIFDSLNHDEDMVSCDPDMAPCHDGCGDQAGYNPAGTNNIMAYGPIAGLGTDDRLYVNTDFDACFFYFGVEAAALGLLGGATAMDCGGRVPQVAAPTQDPIDMTYKIAAGNPTMPPSAALTDGINADDAQTTVSNTVFPFLAAPL